MTDEFQNYKLPLENINKANFIARQSSQDRWIMTERVQGIDRQVFILMW